MKKVVRYEVCLTAPNTDREYYYNTKHIEDLQLYINWAIEHDLDVKYVKGLTR